MMWNSFDVHLILWLNEIVWFSILMVLNAKICLGCPSHLMIWFKGMAILKLDPSSYLIKNFPNQCNLLLSLWPWFRPLFCFPAWKIFLLFGNFFPLLIFSPVWKILPLVKNFYPGQKMFCSCEAIPGKQSGCCCDLHWMDGFQIPWLKGWEK